MIQLGEISKAEAARYMGIRTAPDEKTAELLDHYEKIVRSRLMPAYVWRNLRKRYAVNLVVFLYGMLEPLFPLIRHHRFSMII